MTRRILLSVEQDEVRRLLREKLNMSQDADFLAHKTAACDIVNSYEHEDGPGPDYQKLAFDLANGSKTPWNARILDLLLEDLKERNEKEGWVVRRSDGYYREILEHRYKRLRTIWREGQAKVTAKGTLETGEEVEKRLVAQRDKTLKLVRQATRRRNVCPQSRSRSDANDNARNICEEQKFFITSLS